MRRNRAYFEHAAAKLRGFPCVVDVRTNALTGSIILRYTGTLQQITWIGRRREIFLLTTRDRRDRTPDSAASAGRSLRAAEIRKTWAARGPYSNSPVQNLQNAVVAQRTLQRPWLALTLAALGVYQLWRADPVSTGLNILYALLDRILSGGNPPGWGAAPGLAHFPGSPTTA
jgi:hypothetical protein